MEKEVMIYFKTLFCKMQETLTITSDDDWGREEISVIKDDMDALQNGRDLEIENRIKGRSGLYLKKIDDALERIQKGSFGQCEECGDAISFERLKARPTATMCIKCKEDNERVEGHIPYSRRSHSVGRGLAVVGSNVLDFAKEDKSLTERQILKLTFDKDDI